MYNWTKDQKNFLESFEYYLESRSGSQLCLAASAGSGKTTVSIEAIKIALKETTGLIAVMAPTNTAVRVLMEKLDEAGIIYDRLRGHFNPNDITKRVTVGTIHQFLGSSPDAELCASCEHSSQISGKRSTSLMCQKFNKEVSASFYCGDFSSDEDKPVFSFKDVLDRPLYQFEIVFADEASMISSEQHLMIKESLKDEALLIYIGDQFQLFAVEDDPKLSPTFTTSKLFTLNEIVRYQGKILEVATEVKDTYTPERIDFLRKPFHFPRDVNGEDFTYVKTKADQKFESDWFKLLLSSIPDILAANSRDKIRCLAYRNRTVEETNNKIRQKVFGNQSRLEFYPNEWLFSNGTLYTHHNPYVAIAGMNEDQNELLLDFIEVASETDKDNPSDHYLELLEQVQSEGLKPFYGCPNATDFFIEYSESRSFEYPVPIEYIEYSDQFPKLKQTYSVVKVKTQFKPLFFVTLSPSQLEATARNLQKIFDFANRMSITEDIHHTNIFSYVKKIRKALKLMERPYNTRFPNAYDELFTYSYYPGNVRPDASEIHKYNRRIFCKLGSGMVISTHKSQGSTFENVFFDYADHVAALMYRKSEPLQTRLEMLHRAVYTGLTRAKKSVKVYSTGSEYLSFN